MDSTAVKTLTGAAFAKGMLDREIADLARLARPQFFEGRTTLVPEGADKHPFFVIQDGMVQVVHGATNANPVILAQLGPGEHFGEMGLISPGPSDVGVVTVQATHCLSFEVEALHDHMVANPTLAMKLLWNLSRDLVDRLRRTDGRYVRMYRGHQD